MFAFLFFFVLFKNKAQQRFDLCMCVNVSMCFYMFLWQIMSFVAVCVCVRVCLFVWIFGLVTLESLYVFRIQIVSISIINNTRLKSVRLQFRRTFTAASCNIDESTFRRFQRRIECGVVGLFFLYGLCIFYNFRRFLNRFLNITAAPLNRCFCLQWVTVFFCLKNDYTNVINVR